MKSLSALQIFKGLFSELNSSFAHHLFLAGTGLELLNFQYCPGSGPFDPASGKEGKAYVKLFIQITRLRTAEVKLSPF